MTADDPAEATQPDDVVDAVAALSPADQARLERVAAGMAKLKGLDPEDLLQEALTRAIETRQCPQGVDPVVFIANVMRSVASGEIEKRKRRRNENFAEIGRDPVDLFNLPAAADDPTPEEALIAEQDWNRVLALFDGDDHAQYVLIGIREGHRGATLCEQTGLSKEELATVRRRIVRRIQKINDPGA